VPKEEIKIENVCSENHGRAWAVPEIYVIELKKTSFDPYGSGSDDYGGAYDS
jgi:hypothetical protein